MINTQADTGSQNDAGVRNLWPKNISRWYLTGRYHSRNMELTQAHSVTVNMNHSGQTQGEKYQEGPGKRIKC